MRDIEKILQSPSDNFSGFSSNFDESSFVVFGFPFDATSTYRRGSKAGPREIRKASLNIETYSFRTNTYIEDFKICDLGDIKLTASLPNTLGRIAAVVSRAVKEKKIPILLGGEHTATFGVVDGLPPDTAIVSFDAHFDLRQKYLGKRLSHTTFMRRIAENIGPQKLCFVGTRAICKDEMEYVRRSKVKFLPARHLLYEGWHKAAKEIRDFAQSFRNIYVTLDMDVIDPSEAPGVGNPEAEGLGSVLLLDILQGVVDERLIGFDLVEVAPRYDFGVTSILAARIAFEMIGFKESSQTIKRVVR